MVYDQDDLLRFVSLIDNALVPVGFELSEDERDLMDYLHGGPPWGCPSQAGLGSPFEGLPRDVQGNNIFLLRFALTRTPLPPHVPPSIPTI